MFVYISHLFKKLFGKDIDQSKRSLRMGIGKTDNSQNKCINDNSQNRKGDNVGGDKIEGDKIEKQITYSEIENKKNKEKREKIETKIEMSKMKNVELIDLNYAPLVRLEKPWFKVLPEYYIPEIAFESFVISVPVLKAHSFSKVTLSLKNMMGFAPPEHYQVGGYWKKSYFHDYMHLAILEMIAYRTPDMAVLDATIGMCDYHLGGRQCSPPVNKLIAGFDPVAVDKKGAELLGFDWHNIPHIAEAYDYMESD